jgi:hypothetical protein
MEGEHWLTWNYYERHDDKPCPLLPKKKNKVNNYNKVVMVVAVAINRLLPLSRL